MKNTFAAIILISIMAFACPVAKALDFGIKGGLIFSSIPSTDLFDVELPDGTDAYFGILDDNYTGYHLGVVAEVSVLSFFVQPGLFYTKTGQDMMLEYDRLDGSREMEYLTTEFNHLKMPIIAGAGFALARVGVGPVFSVMFDQRDDLLGDFESVFNFNNTTVGYQLMAGIKFSGFTLDYRFESSLSSFGDSINIAGQSFGFDTHPRKHYISLGIMLF